jgi:hypothetical protein
MQLPPSAGQMEAAILLVFVLGLILWPLTYAVRMGAYRVAVVFLVCCLVPLNSLRDVLGDRFFPYLKFSLIKRVGLPATAMIIAAVAVVAIISIAKYAVPLSRILMAVLLTFSPFLVLTIGQASWRIAGYDDTSFRDPTFSRSHRSIEPAHRIVWVVLDEVDQRIVFEDRPNGLNLPEFDRIRSVSLYASNAIEPGPETCVSMPAFILGKSLKRMREVDPNEMQVMFNGTSVWTDWRDSGNIFHQARLMGVSTGLVGWYLPYCRAFASDLDRCWWREAVGPGNSTGRDLRRAVFNEGRSLFETANFSPFGQSLTVQHHAANVQETIIEAKALLSDKTIGLVLLHIQGAHGPHAFDRRSGRFTLANSPVRGYADSLALTDAVLRQFREIMERNGSWDSSVFLVTADHHYRTSRAFDGKVSYRVPFLVKLPEQTTSIEFTHPFNAVVAHDLVIELLKGNLTSKEELAEWLTNKSISLPQSQPGSSN